MTDAPGFRLPIKLDATSNGEYEPIPLTPVQRHANRVAVVETAEAARRLNLPRRRYLASTCGAAATLLAFDQVLAAGSPAASTGRGGRYMVPREAAFEPQLAEATVGGNEFIFDVQLHHVVPGGAWRAKAPGWERALRHMPNAGCGESDALQCFSRERLLKDVFLDSDTSMAVLSHVPGLSDANPLTHEEALATKRVLDALDGTERLLLHARVHPAEPGALERMAEHAASVKLGAFKTYTQFDAGIEGSPGGWWLDDEKLGLPMIEQARKLGVRNICIHKGLLLSPRGTHFAGCRDIGAVAKRYPDMNFIVYHSGYLVQRPEGPFDPARAGGMSGIDDLVSALKDNGIGPNGNVYAELGSTWRIVMRNPEVAAHLLGKLLVHVGENNVLWGTDSIWYGSPQDQIQAFRAFQISKEFQERHGYPALTAELKRKVFGLNGARVYGLKPEALRPKLQRDRVGKVRAEYLPIADPSFETHGPKTRREFLALRRAAGVG
ncbi:MAG: amidohydrolase family protein [Rubrivivax sp.]|nr:amidohydrolase family protein [Rubrivivax sp.]